MAKHYAMVFEGQGQFLGDLGNPQKAKVRAAKTLGCDATALQIVSTGAEVWWFDATKTDTAYWLAALKLDTSKPHFAGKPAC